MSATVTGRPMAVATRPSFPPLGWFAAALWTGVWIAEALAWRGGLPMRAVIAMSVAALAVALVVVLRSNATHSPAALLILLGIALGLAVGGTYWLRSDSMISEMRTLSRGGRVQAVADGTCSPFGVSIRARVLEGPARGALFSATLPDGLPVVPMSGDTLLVSGSPVTGAKRDAYARQRHRAGETCRLRVWSARFGKPGDSLVARVVPMRRRLVQAVEHIGGDRGALLQGILLGERSRLRGTSLEEAFRTTGLSHVLAVSGTHLVIVAYIFGAFLERTRLARSARMLLVFGFALLYVLLTGAPVSAVRALLMTAAAVVASLSGRRADSLSALAMAVCLVLLHSPPQAFDIGFALSVSAVAGLIVFSALASEWAQMIAGRILKRPARSLVTPIVAQAATAPVSIPAFNMVSVIGPVANIAVLPLASVSLAVGVAGAIIYLAVPAAGMPLLELSALPLILVARVTTYLAAVPYAAIPLGGSAVGWGIGSALGAAALWVAWPAPVAPRIARLVTCAALVSGSYFIVGGATAAATAELVVLDVGQGDAILVRDGRNAVLIDAGPSPSSMRAAAARMGLRHLDAVILSHPHADHTGGLAGLTGVVDVSAVFVPAATVDEFASVGRAVDGLTGRQVGTLEAGSVIGAGQWRLEVLWPPAETEPDAECNDTSMVIRLSGPGGISAILTGDAEEAAQEGMARLRPLEPCVILKVPHHGSSGGIAAEALSAWQPKVALVSVGAGNEFGHPHGATLDQLSEAGVRVLRTDRDGDIRVRTGASGYRVSVSQGEARHSMRPIACATIASADVRESHHSEPSWNGSHGNHGPFRPQARIPYSWHRGLATRTGHRSAQTPLRRCRGP